MRDVLGKSELHNSSFPTGLEAAPNVPSHMAIPKALPSLSRSDLQPGLNPRHTEVTSYSRGEAPVGACFHSALEQTA